MADPFTPVDSAIQEWSIATEDVVAARKRLETAVAAVQKNTTADSATEYFTAMRDFKRAIDYLNLTLTSIDVQVDEGQFYDHKGQQQATELAAKFPSTMKGTTGIRAKGLNTSPNSKMDMAIYQYGLDAVLLARKYLDELTETTDKVVAAGVLDAAKQAADKNKQGGFDKSAAAFTKGLKDAFASGDGGSDGVAIKEPPPAKPAPLPAPIGHYQGIPIYFQGPDGNMPGLPVNDIEAKKLTDAGLSYGVTPTNLIERGVTGLVLLSLEAQRSGGPGSPRRADVVLSMTGVGTGGNATGFTMGLSGIINAINKGQLAGEIADQMKESVEDNAKFRFAEKYNAANPLMNPFANTKPIALDTFGNVVPVDGEDVSPEHYRELALATGRPYAGPGVEHGQFYTEVNGKIEVGGRIDEADLATREIYERTGVTPGAGQATPGPGEEDTGGMAYLGNPDTGYTAVQNYPNAASAPPPGPDIPIDPLFTKTLAELLEVYGGNLSVPQRNMLALEYGKIAGGTNSMTPFEFLSSVWPGVADLRPIEARFPRVSQSSSNPRRVNF